MELELSQPVGKLGELFHLDQNVGPTERTFSTVAGGALLAMAAGKNSWAAMPVGLLGGALLLRGLTGHCEMYKQMGLSSTQGGHHLNKGGGLLQGVVKVQKTVTVKGTPSKLYSFWRNFENLPRFTENLISVTESEPGITQWVARGPGDTRVEWTAKIHEDTPDHRISWSTIEGSDIDHNGSVMFTPAPAGRGTELRVVLRYQIPGGKLGQALAKVLGDEPGQQIDADLRRLKQILEAGEVARTDGQPAGAGRVTTGQMSTNHAILDV